jgi:hypothetical protein
MTTRSKSGNPKASDQVTEKTEVYAAEEDQPQSKMPPPISYKKRVTFESVPEQLVQVHGRGGIKFESAPEQPVEVRSRGGLKFESTPEQPVKVRGCTKQTAQALPRSCIPA